jgi:hypothetical protein
MKLRALVACLAVAGSLIVSAPAAQAAGSCWFICQRKTVVKLEYGSIKNDWFAYTLGDNGYWGWVSATHFSAGGNWEPVPGLGHCPSGFGETEGHPGDRPRPGTRFVTPGPDGETSVRIN